MRLHRFETPDQGVMRAVEIDGAFFCFDGSGPEGSPLNVDSWRRLAPVEPTKIICVGLNYRAHAAEQNKPVPREPLIFMKPLSALNAPGAPIVIPRQSELVHHEAELGFVIGRQAREVSADDAMDHILGFTCANDVTARDIQRREKRYTRAKGYDTFCCVGPCVVTTDEFDYRSGTVQGFVNGDRVQDGRFDDFIFDIPTVVSFISHIMTLEVGDLILTGTPSGVGPLESGDTVEIVIDGIGRLSNPVIAA